MTHSLNETKAKLKQLKNVSSDCCITLILPTHRTAPDNEKDPIVLKNLMKEAENRLPESCDPGQAKLLTDKLHRLAATIDHRHNQEALALFVSNDISEYLRLPMTAAERVSIGNSFYVRDVVRALFREEGYYLLVLSRDTARLVEGFTDRVVASEPGGFPLKSEFLNSPRITHDDISDRETAFAREFFDRIDEKLEQVLANNPLPLIISGDDAIYQLFLNQSRLKSKVAGHLPGNRTDESASLLVSHAWPVILQLRKEANLNRKEELDAAAGANNVLTEINDIWRAVNEGRGRTLFTAKGLSMPARVTDEMNVTLVSPDSAEDRGVVDDIIDDIVELNLKFGGDAVFLPDEALENYQGLALTTRF